MSKHEIFTLPDGKEVEGFLTDDNKATINGTREGVPDKDELVITSTSGYRFIRTLSPWLPSRFFQFKRL